ncbi:hypothetical protein EML15_09225 [Corynebacterium sp. sy017]|uniref:hypothetical protein n=1 Tax=unclassified Corynebacterium TaxID=2624378 RepID=UPI0011860E0A|nr:MULTISPECIES: hypothetical protein [unclassified Corynebacterium]MBP3089320.1 hypothetical protein [Corynebacterium sp. sy017]QDZ43257.1 hypothetical protein FQV43_08910 [Corynebacterium sp. sy039]TSD90980.1 hypothetical protein ELY17_09375 [Corynebacterium sp. SY003]
MNTSKHSLSSGAPQKPESMRDGERLWLLVFAGEIIHAVCSAILAWHTRGVSRKQVRELLPAGMHYSDKLLDLSLAISIFLNLCLSLVVLSLFFWAYRSVVTSGKYALRSRRILNFFAVYLAVRAFFVFFSGSLTPTTIPIYFTAFDGCVQILIGVGAIMALVFFNQKEVQSWLENNNDDNPPGTAGKLNYSQHTSADHRKKR